MIPIATCIKKTFDFNGRADLVEFWSFFMFLYLIQMLAFFIDVATGMIVYNWIGSFPLAPITETVRLLFLLPFLAVLCRRLHDVGKGNSYALIIVIPIAGFLYLLPLLIKEGQDKSNNLGVSIREV